MMAVAELMRTSTETHCLQFMKKIITGGTNQGELDHTERQYSKHTLTLCSNTLAHVIKMEWFDTKSLMFNVD